jgi:hypothetical protein
MVGLVTTSLAPGPFFSRRLRISGAPITYAGIKSNVSTSDAVLK